MRSTVSRWLPSQTEIRLGDGPSERQRAPGLARGVDALVAEFEHGLDAQPLRRGTRLRCMLAGEAVRFAIVPWIEAMTSPDLRQRLAEQCFREIYGDAAADWRLSWHAGPYGSATLACAIDASLLDKLEAAAQARGLSVFSVQPSLMHAFNQSRRAIEPGAFWFVSFERHWTTMLLMSDREPLLVKRVPSASVALSGLLDREWFALGMEAPPCLVYIVRSAQVPATPTPWRGVASARWRFIDLSPATEAAVQPSAMEVA